MENYPPTNETGLSVACRSLIADPTADGLKAFLVSQQGSGSRSPSTNTPRPNLESELGTKVGAAAASISRRSSRKAALRGSKKHTSMGEFLFLVFICQLFVVICTTGAFRT